MRGRLAVAATALVAVLTSTPAVAGPGDAAKVRACVERNLVRYTTPDRAVVAQYVDITAACQAAVAGDEDVAVVLSPLPGDTGATGGRGAGADGTAGTAPGGSGPDGPGPGGHGRGAVGGAARPDGASAAAAVVRAALTAPPEGARAPGASGLTAAPPWILGLLAAALAGSAGAAAVGWRRRR